MSLPLRYRKASLLDFSKPLQKQVLDWLGKPGDGLLLMGPIGTGKTHLAAAITRTMVMVSRPIIFRKAADLYEALREAFRLNVSEAMVLDEYRKTWMLALDDVGAGSLSDHERRSFLDVLDKRLDAMIPTIVTTNWSLEQISEKIDDRIASRLGSFLHIELCGNDRRIDPNI